MIEKNFRTIDKNAVDGNNKNKIETVTTFDILNDDLVVINYIQTTY